MRSAPLVIGLALACLSATAATPAPAPAALPAPPPQDWFEVELIVFRNTQQGAGASETWPADPGRPAVEQARELQTSDGAAPAADAASLAFQPLPPSASRLATQWDKLVKSSRYEPIGYFAWVQPPLDRSAAQPVRIALPLPPAPPAQEPMLGTDPAAVPATGAAPPFAFGADPAAPPVPPLRTPLDGTATVGLARYLYLTLDLVFQPGDLAPTAEGIPAPPFRLTETRRMRSKELHYFDHPLFGAIALITPRPAPTQPTAAPEPTR